MKNIIILCIGLSILFNSCNTKPVDNKTLTKSISRTIEQLPYLCNDTVYLKKDKLTLIYKDSIPFAQPHIEREQLFYILRGICLIKKNKIDTIAVTIYYPNRKHTNKYTENIISSNIKEGVKLRFCENDKYREVLQLLLFDRNSRYGFGTLILLNDRYGFLLDTNPKDIPYNENSFELFYRYINECNRGVKGEASRMFKRIEENIEQIPNTDYVLEKLNMIREICKSDPN